MRTSGRMAFVEKIYELGWDDGECSFEHTHLDKIWPRVFAVFEGPYDSCDLFLREERVIRRFGNVS